MIKMMALVRVIVRSEGNRFPLARNGVLEVARLLGALELGFEVLT